MPGLPTTSVTVVIRLALIEDHHALRQGLELLLGREGCDVVGTAGTAREGLELVQATEPDVTVIDVGLGADSGIDLARELLAQRPERRIVLYTGSSEVEHLLDGLDTGARGYALKEGAPQELMEAIAAVAAGDGYVDPRLRPALLSQDSTRRQPALSTREREIIQLLAEGLTGEEVADRLVLSAETIKTHIRNAMTKLEARNRVHAIAIALRAGEISLGTAAGMAVQ
jgi:DNA-binding NarL/FixJ family response regulator